jgi:hypothetical protein
VVAAEQQAMKEAQERVTIPVHYGAQPDLGRYSTPDGPCGNWAELLPGLRVDEARAAQEAAVELAVADMVFVAEALWEAGADGVNFDTAGAAGDADFLAALLAVERLRAAHPDIGIMVGMAPSACWARTASWRQGRACAGSGRPPAKLSRRPSDDLAPRSTSTGRSLAWNTSAPALAALHGARASWHMNVGRASAARRCTPCRP